MRKAVRQAAKATSFQDVSEDLEELAQVSISPSHLQRLGERIGTEWVAARDACEYARPQAVARSSSK